MKLLTVEDVMAIGIGKRTTIWKKVKSGEFPKPVRLGNSPSSPIRWREDDINYYLNNLGNSYGGL